MESTPKSSSRNNEGDVDLGQLFYKTGGFINSFFSSIGRGFRYAGSGLLSILFFLRRNALWLALGLIAGLAVGIYQLQKTGPKYTSTLTVRTNFNSSRALYGTMDFLNALVSSGRYDELARTLNITPAEAESLSYFEAVPVESEIITSDMYRDQFLHADAFNQLDTFWMRTITYKDFKNALTKFDYPLHDIKVVSTNAMVFSKIQDGILTKISSNKLLRDLKTTEDETNKETATLLRSSIQSLDTLGASYNKRIASGAKTSEPGNNITLLQGGHETHTPELELYDKMLELKDQLNITKRQSVIGSQIVQVYSPFSFIGQKESFFRQNLVKDSISGFIAALIIVCLIGLYRYLKNLEKQKAPKPI